jgi:hypothetical protein
MRIYLSCSGSGRKVFVGRTFRKIKSWKTGKRLDRSEKVKRRIGEKVKRQSGFTFQPLSLLAFTGL